ncbi:hypothetical protein [Bacillus marasmi]|uniref:hypothetical protein n=1 Tax=Bacillus marasmi TaxID=1926279 RepID=UPI0011C78DDC|nr:hypothetical protein [Bacillus marasmi]
MYAVHYFEGKTNLLSQLLNNVPAVGDKLKIKGRKATVIGITTFEENKIHVLVELEAIKKSKVIVDQSKKKRR